MADNYGVSFAPTNENSQQGPMNGQIDGLPAAIKILALRFPKFFGASSPAPQELQQAPGAQGIDPIASAVLASMAKALGSHSMGLPGASMGLPGGTAGPNPPGSQMPGRPPRDPGPGPLPQDGEKPHIVFEPGTGGAQRPPRPFGGFPPPPKRGGPLF